MSSKPGSISPVNSPDRSLNDAEMFTIPSTPSGTTKTNKKSEPHSKTSKPKPSKLESYHFGPIASLEQMEPKVLLFQNKKLAERLEHYQHKTEEQRNLNEQLQLRLSATDAEIFIINRHTKSLDENVRVLLKRFETENLGEGDAEDPSSPAAAFINQLSTLDEEELDRNLSGRAQEMLNVIGKLLQLYERVWNQSRTVLEKLKNNESCDEEQRVLSENVLQKNAVLERQVTKLQNKAHVATLQASKFADQVTKLETERDELKNRTADLAWSLDKEQTRREKAENMALELREQLKSYQVQLGAQRKEGVVETSAAPADISQSKMGEMVTDLEEQKTLAANRLHEIEKLHSEKVTLTLELEELKVQVQSPPDDLVISSAKYKSLQTHFSVLFVEHEKLKEYYKTAREAVNTLRTSYLQQLKDAQRHEEDGSQTFQTFLSTLQTATNAARRDYQMLRIEYEQEHASRETSGTHKDYDKLFKSVMQHNNSMQSEVMRLRKRIQSLQVELAKCQPKDPSKSKSCSPDKRNITDGECSGKRDSGGSDGPGIQRQGSQGSLQTDLTESPDTRGDQQTVKDLKKQLKDKTKDYDELKLLYDITKQAGKNNRELVEIMASEKKLKEENVDLKRKLAAAEEKSRLSETEQRTSTQELESLRLRTKQLDEKIQELEREYEKERSERVRGAQDEEVNKRVKFLEEALASSKKLNAGHKLEEEAMMNEMEITGQALEDLQNQNKQLIDQLKEKDNTNLKWMTDNIRNNQIIKTLRDEKVAQENRFRTSAECIVKYEMQLKLAEDRIKAIEDVNDVLEEDRRNGEYIMESWKRKAFEQTKESNDLRLKLDQLEKELKFIRKVHEDKLKSWEGDAYKGKRLIEENSELKRKLDRAKLIELTGSSEEILREDIREYKELLNCTSCKAARKDTVLTKCYHVFCYSCISKRYETRQRRCPQCSTPFGANDFHRLYLT